MKNNIHPYPWTVDRNHIKDAEGNVIASVPYTLGDELDHNSGELMAKAPELLQAAGEALQIIGDILRHENLKPGSREALEAAEKHLRKAIETGRRIK